MKNNTSVILKPEISGIRPASKDDRKKPRRTIGAGGRFRLISWLPCILPAFFWVLATGLLVETAVGQHVRHTTLMGWEEQTQLIILDRYNNFGGIFYDRGLFRFTTPPMIEHHDLDLQTYGFSGPEEYEWYANAENSFRAFGGSFNIGEYLHGAQIRNFIQVSDNLSIPVQFHRRYDMRQDRALAWLGLHYTVTGEHSAGIKHTLTENKPDLDATFYYRYGDLGSRRVQAEITVLDWANNSAYDLGQRRGERFPELRRYEQRPFLFSVKAASPIRGNLRGELAAGLQTPLQAEAESMRELENVSLVDRERARYAGALLEYAIPHFTGAISWRHTYARFSRSNAEEQPAEPVDYGNNQLHHSAGLFLSFNYSNVYFDTHTWYHANRDRQSDRFNSRVVHGELVYPFNYREERWMMQYTLGYDTRTRGLLAALEFHADYRTPLGGEITRPDGSSVRGLPYHLQYPHSIDERNERLTLRIGYRFSEKSYLMFGASADLDREVFIEEADRQRRITPSVFDGGFGRVVVFW